MATKGYDKEFAGLTESRTADAMNPLIHCHISPLQLPQKHPLRVNHPPQDAQFLRRRDRRLDRACGVQGEAGVRGHGLG